MVRCLTAPFVVPPFDPEVAPYSGDEPAVTGWLLDYQRYVLLRKVDGITEQQARMTIAASDLTLLGLVRHLAGVEQYWFGDIFLGLDETSHWHDPDDRDRDFHPLDGDTLAEALVVLRAEIDRSRQIASTAPLDALSIGQTRGPARQPALDHGASRRGVRPPLWPCRSAPRGDRRHDRRLTIVLVVGASRAARPESSRPCDRGCDRSR